MDGERLFLFYHDRVYTATTASLAEVQRGKRFPEPKLSSSNVFLWSSFDIKGNNEPRRFLVQPPCLPVQTAPPDSSCYKTWDKEQAPLLTALPLWTRKELAQGYALPISCFCPRLSTHLPRISYQKRYQSLLKALREGYLSPAQNEKDPLHPFPGARAVLQEGEEDGVLSSPEDALGYLLEAAIERFGYSARDVFNAIFDYNSSIRRHQQAFSIKYTDFQDAVCALWINQSADHSISHRILALWPVHSAPFERVRWEVKFKSNWVGKSVFQQLGAVENDALWRQICFLQGIPEAGQLAGQFLEPLAHRSIANSTGGFWPLINMAPNNADSPLFTVLRNSSIPVSDDVQFPKIKREIVKFQSIADLSMKNNVYYIPADPNFPLFDSFTIVLDHSKKSAVLWVLQMTKSRLHGGSARGYLKIRNIIANLKSQLGGDPPPKKTTKVAAGQISSIPHVRVCYLLVIPKGDYESRTSWDFPEGWNEDCVRHDHCGNVYCLEVPVAVCSTIVKNILSSECIASRYPTSLRLDNDVANNSIISFLSIVSNHILPPEAIIPCTLFMRQFNCQIFL